MPGRSEAPSHVASPTTGPRRRWPWATSLTTLVILGALMMPGPAVPDVGFDGIDLLAHLCLFGAWGAAVVWEWAPRWWVLLVVGLAFAVGTEALQTVAVQRTFSLSDIVADLVGITLGAGLAHLVRRRLLQAAEQR